VINLIADYGFARERCRRPSFTDIPSRQRVGLAVEKEKQINNTATGRISRG
jgi:hypothetical protein